MLGAIKSFFGVPIRKIKYEMIVGVIVPSLIFADGYFAFGLGEQMVNVIGGGIAATVLVWLPIIQGYVTKRHKTSRTFLGN
jgi:hypothetical protein